MEKLARRQGKQMASLSTRSFGQISLVDEVDVVVVEGTVAGVEIAWQLSRAGLRVGLVCRGTSLPYEIASCMRAWMPGQIDDIEGPVADILRQNHDEGIVDLGAAAEALEDLMLDSSVQFYYDARAAGALMLGDEVAGVAFAGKFGLAAIRAAAVVDCSPEAIVARSAGVPLMPTSPAHSRIGYVCHLGAKGLPSITGGRLGNFEANVHGPYLELSRDWEIHQESDLWYSKASVDLRRELIAAALLPDSDEVPTLRIDRGADDLVYTPPFRPKLNTGHSGGAKVDFASHPIGVEVASGCAATSDLEADRIAWDWSYSLRWAKTQGPRIVSSIGNAVDKAGPASVQTTSHFRLGSPVISQRDTRPSSSAAAGSRKPEIHSSNVSENLQLRLTDADYLEKGATQITIELPPISTAAAVDLLVAGGGTAGTPAAEEGARRGLSVLCAEKHGDLGGAHTTGGVSYYWFGRWSTYFRRRFRRMSDFYESTGLPNALAQLHLAQNVEILLRAPAAGCVLEAAVNSTRFGPGASSIERGDGVPDNSRLRGVLAVGANGLVLLEGKVIIDATGDGDIAAWGGAPYTYGSERDDITLWCSFGAFRSGSSEASRQYLTVADQRSVADIRRAIIAGRRQPGIFGNGDFPQHYLVTREARHIQARKRVHYVDTLADCDYEDSVFVCRSNIDIKGLPASDAAFAGFIEPDFFRNFSAHIPFASMVPRSLDNLLVAGKAYSASHDGIAMARMQTDMITMGGVAGIAAATALRSAVDIPALGVSDFRQSLIEAGTIDAAETVVRPEHREEGMTDDDLEVLCHRVSLGPIELDDQARILAHGQRSVPFLRDALSSGLDRQAIVVARMLCTLGDATGSDILLRRLHELLSENSLPRFEHRRHIFPDHGFAPEPVYLIGALALAGDLRLLRALERVEALLELDPSVSDDRFTYVHIISYALERLPLDGEDTADVEAEEGSISRREARPNNVADAQAIATHLLDHPALQSRIITGDMDPRLCADAVGERYAYLGLCMNRALARCGGVRGWIGLTDYLSDIRSFLHRSALQELRDLSRMDLGYDGPAWRRALDHAEVAPPAEPGCDSEHVNKAEAIDCERPRPLRRNFG